jgi:LuxR family maltose regulon positive regulatory protein
VGDVDPARDLLDEAEALYRPGFYPDLRPIPAMRARLQIVEGDLASATEWVQERGLGVDDPADYLHEYEHLTLARLVIAQHHAGAAPRETGQDADIPRLLDLLDRMHTDAAAVQRHGSVLEIVLLQALAHHAQGDVASALAALAQAVLDVPEPEGYVRLYLDEGPPMLDLLRVAAAGDAGAVRDRARQLLVVTASAETDGPAQSLVDPLTGRELEVLRLLATDLTGPQIAGQLFVSLNTFRTHSKRIFTKLDVTTRAAAVRRGEGLGLLG